MSRSPFGIDWVDLVIQVAITAMFMVIADSASSGPGNDAAIAGVVVVSLGVLGWRRKRWLERRGPDSDTNPGSPNRMYDLENRVADLEAQQGRVLELEERLDFAERLLTQQRDTLRQLDAPRQEA
ncbi:MAG: hypothetical protein ABI587_14070 [Gemmatimonadales bacterium]